MIQTRTTRTPRPVKVPLPNVGDPLLAERGAALVAAAAQVEAAAAAVNVLFPVRDDA